MYYFGGVFDDNLIGLYDSTKNYFSFVTMKRITTLLDNGYTIVGISKDLESGTLKMVRDMTVNGVFAYTKVTSYTLILYKPINFDKLPKGFVCEYNGLRIEVNRNRNLREMNYKCGSIKSVSNSLTPTFRPIDYYMTFVREFLSMQCSDKYLIQWELQLFIRNNQYLDLNVAFAKLPRRIGRFVINWDISLFLEKTTLQWVKYDCTDVDKLLTKLSGTSPFSTCVDVQILYVDVANELKVGNIESIEKFIDNYMTQNGLVFINSFTAIQYIQESYANTDRQIIYLGEYSKNEIKRILAQQAKYMLMNNTTKNKITYLVNVKEKSVF